VTVTEGQKIRIRDEYHWARGATGTIMIHPANKSLTRAVQARIGEKIFVWVKFDVAQIDADGDGPYIEAEIDLDFLDNPQ
jgi:hypothetical protein